MSDPIAFFGKDGWQVFENIHIPDEADRLAVNLPLGKFPWTLLMRFFKMDPQKGNKTYGCVMYGRW
jgi:hypothetical protein